MTPDELDRRFSAAVADADHVLVSEGRVAPAFLIVGRDYRAQLVAPDFSSQESKSASFALMRLIAIAGAAILVVQRTEAWIVVDPTPGIRPSQSDRRREAVLVLAAARGEDGTILTRISTREIVRGADGRVTGTRVLAVPDDIVLSGPMGELLPPAPPTPAERRAARAVLAHATKRMSRGKSAFTQH